MDNIFKRVMKATLIIDDEELPPEPDPVADILQKALAAKESSPKAVMKKTQPVLEVPNRNGAQKPVPRDPLVRLIQESDDSDTKMNIRTQISETMNAFEKVEDTVAENEALPVNKTGKQAQAPVILPAVNNQPVTEGAAIQSIQHLNNGAALPGEKSGSVLKPIAKTVLPVQPDQVNRKDIAQTTGELSGNPSQAKIQEPPQNTSVKSFPSTEVSPVPVSQEKTAQGKQVNGPLKKGDTGGIMDIFLEEEKKEKNEALSAGLENIDSKKLLEQAGDILAVLKMKVNR